MGLLQEMRAVAPSTRPPKVRRQTIAAELLDADLGQALDRTEGSIEDLCEPDAVVRTLDRRRAQPYDLSASHRWRFDALTGA